ncbi:hypothetical protein ACIQGO_32835 [Streptomyces shenzhenensis]|uniref:hypothetical protein n=1 Tax=Streptomyces shenzhenensis TaxID=943815 RepID=UPI0038184257
MRGVDSVRREVLRTDGPFAETKEYVAGFGVVDCAEVHQPAGGPEPTGTDALRRSLEERFATPAGPAHPEVLGLRVRSGEASAFSHALVRLRATRHLPRRPAVLPWRRRAYRGPELPADDRPVVPDRRFAGPCLGG